MGYAHCPQTHLLLFFFSSFFFGNVIPCRTGTGNLLRLCFLWDYLFIILSRVLCLPQKKCEVAKKLREALEWSSPLMVVKIKVLYYIFQHKLPLPQMLVLTDKSVLGKHPPFSILGWKPFLLIPSQILTAFLTYPKLVKWWDGKIQASSVQKAPGTAKNKMTSSFFCHLHFFPPQ